MSKESKQTVIESGTEFDGSIRSDCSIKLSGNVKGELRAPSLEVTPSGAVRGKVRVKQLNSQGEVEGDIQAESVELSGRVNDKTVIRAKNLEVKLSQTDKAVEVSFGNCELQVGDAPAEMTDNMHSDREARADSGSDQKMADAMADLMKK